MVMIMGRRLVVRVVALKLVVLALIIDFSSILAYYSSIFVYQL
jgi:hypothetical protein